MTLASQSSRLYLRVIREIEIPLEYNATREIQTRKSATANVEGWVCTTGGGHAKQ